MFNVFSPLFKLVRNLRRVVSDCLSFFASIGLLVIKIGSAIRTNGLGRVLQVRLRLGE
jgi:hypothetical protein